MTNLSYMDALSAFASLSTGCSKKLHKV